jgi:uncharacterized protein involved in exopolysaccharide biosynthesis
MNEARETEDLIDVGRAIAVLFEAWRPLVIVALVGTTIGAAGSLMMPNVYRASTIVMPVKNDGGLGGGIRSQLGSLVPLVGIELSGSGDRTVEAVATLGAAGFVRDFIESEGVLPVLFADEWDGTAGAWRDADEAPTLEDGVVKFRTKVMRIVEDRKSGLITLNIEWTDPEQAARWANRIIERLNDQMRLEAIEDGKRRIDYLRQELAQSSVVEVQRAIYSSIEAQVQAGMIANVQREFAFRTIDRAVAPDAKRKVGPRRSLIALASGFGAGSLWGLVVLWRTRRRWLVAG